MKLDWRNPAVSAVAAAVLLLIGGPGYWFYSESVKDAQRESVGQLVAESTQALGLALSLRGGEGEAAQLDALVTDAEARLGALRAIPNRREHAVFDAAENYIVDSQRVIRRQAQVVRARATAAASQNALMAHMAEAGNRTAEWIGQAVALRKKLEGHFYDYRVASASYAAALDAMPATRKQVMDLALRVPLYDLAAFGTVQARAAEDAKAAAEGLDSLKRLPPPR